MESDVGQKGFKGPEILGRMEVVDPKRGQRWHKEWHDFGHVDDMQVTRHQDVDRLLREEVFQADWILVKIHLFLGSEVRLFRVGIKVSFFTRELKFF